MAGPVPLHAAIAVSVTAVLLAPSRESRRGTFVFNKSSQVLYIKFAEADVSATSFTLRVPANWWYEMPWGNVFTGKIYGVWAGADASGSAQVTELVN
jgi:hypothetical protein